MIHAREDYNGIQDTNGDTSIGDNEPVFVLRAKDILAPQTLRFWANKLKESGGDLRTANHILDWANKMVMWQYENQAKVPDTPHDVLIKCEPL